MNDISFHNSLVVFWPSDVCSVDACQFFIPTPYGNILAQWHCQTMWFARGSPHARIYAAKEIGAQHVLEFIPLTAVNRLLSVGDIFLPSDLVDFTHSNCNTFFVGKGYGFLSQSPPFCPDLRTILFETTQHIVADSPLALRPRVFCRGIYGGCDDEMLLAQHIHHLLADWDIDALGTQGIPTSFLAHELELCYALFGYVTDAISSDGEKRSSHPLPHMQNLLQDIGEAVQRVLPAQRTCLCQNTMQNARTHAGLSEDWHRWLISEQ